MVHLNPNGIYLPRDIEPDPCRVCTFLLRAYITFAVLTIIGASLWVAGYV